jgi:hypothetical protein
LPLSSWLFASELPLALTSETVACTIISVLEAEVSQYWKNCFLLLFVTHLGMWRTFHNGFFAVHRFFLQSTGFFFAVYGLFYAVNVKKIAGNVKKIAGNVIIKAVILKKWHFQSSRLLSRTFVRDGPFGGLPGVPPY